MNITKEVITTPFSYVATNSSIVREGCTPVFVDIDPETLNIDPKKIEDAITVDTGKPGAAIMVIKVRMIFTGLGLTGKTQSSMQQWVS